MTIRGFADYPFLLFQAFPNAIRSKPFFTEVQTELLGISVEHQFGPQRVRTGVHHPKVFVKIQRNFVGLLIGAYQSNDYGLGFAATSLGQVGKQRTLRRHKFDWNLKLRILHGYFPRLTRFVLRVNKAHSNPIVVLSNRVLNTAFHDDRVNGTLCVANQAERKKRAKYSNPSISESGRHTTFLWLGHADMLSLDC